MGIHFQAEPAEIERFAFTCGHHEGVTGHDYRTHDDAYTALGQLVEVNGHAGSLAVCGDEFCASGSGIMFVHAVEVDPSEAFKVSGSSGARILAALGESFSEAGSMDAGVMSGRISQALPEAGDQVRSRLEALAGIARFAAERGRKVVWS